MARRVSFSGRHLLLDEIHHHHRDVRDALLLYYRQGHDGFELGFLGYTAAGLDSELNARLIEVDVASCFSLLAAVEAAFRIDYLRRSYLKMKDPISRDLRELHKRQGARVSFEHDIPRCVEGTLNSAANDRRAAWCS